MSDIRNPPTDQQLDEIQSAASRCRCMCPNGCYCGCDCPAVIELRSEAQRRRDADGGPIRIQRVAGRRKPQNAAYVGRPTRFGNPARIVRDGHGLLVQWGDTGGSVGTWPNEAEARRYATEVYRAWISQPEQADTRRLFRALLHGRDLTCWCPLPTDGGPDHCHAAVLISLVNQQES